MAEDPNTGFKEKLKQTILTDAGRPQRRAINLNASYR